MLAILRTQPTGAAVSTYLDATVSLRDGTKNIPDCPDIVFPIKTYQKIADAKESSTNAAVGDQILLPANLFFEGLTLAEQTELYKMYSNSKRIISGITMDNRREIQDALQDCIFNTTRRLNLAEKTIDFCRTQRFVYPDLSAAGTEPHHSKEKTFNVNEYIEITAIAILSKIMVPIWGDFIGRLSDIGIHITQREEFAFNLVETTLEEGAFENIYRKLDYSLKSTIGLMRTSIDKKPMNNASTSFILTHNGVDDQMFETMIMATIVVKRLATYECFARQREGNPPNVMVYVDDGIKRSTESRIKTMRDAMKTLPKRELSGHDTEDNSSILDHVSRTSSKSIDVPILVITATEQWEMDKILADNDIPLDVYNSAVAYYSTNPFDISPLTQAMMASFIGTRLGGSKCINYLTPQLYQKLVVILQIFLIRNGLTDLAALASSNTSRDQIEGVDSIMAVRIKANYESEEYARCKEIFKGYLDKPVIPIGKKQQRRRTQEVDRIDFVNHIARMIEWLIRHTHGENMAPTLWDFAKREQRPIVGSECQFDEYIVQNLCRYYLIFHDGKSSL